MEAKNGEEAFERVVEAATSFELIVTDIQMPICDGFQFARKVRSQLSEFDTPLTLPSMTPSNTGSADAFF